MKKLLIQLNGKLHSAKWRKLYVQLMEARLAYTSVQYNQALYCWLTNLKVLIFISLKMIMDSSKISRWNIPFKKFSSC